MTDAVFVSSSFSQYTARALQAQPDLAGNLAALVHQPLTRAWMERRLDALGVPGPLPRQGKPEVLDVPAAAAASDGAAAAPAPARATDEQLKRGLRQLRTEVFCAVMERDLAGVADVAEVTAAMSDLAELSIQRALHNLGAELETLYGEPRRPDGARQTLGVVGMGKLGGRELNVSSDIDLIFIYEEDGETAGGSRAPTSSQEFFTRLGRQLIGALSEITAHGYVFRVDMRLRPNGDSGPLVCSLAMLEEYFYVQGREWERYAWIKGRLVTELESPAAQRLAAQLEALVRPFVYRRYLDFGVIGAIRSLHLQIRQEAERRASMRPDKADDIKLGRGGIREIEFSAQVFQLIRGGQDAAFRIRPTLMVLAHAVSQGLLGKAVGEGLTAAYLFLRRLEHRLQYANDSQTHAMPVDPAERARLAGSLGMPDYAALLAALDAHRQFVEQQFDQIFADKHAAKPLAERPGQALPSGAGSTTCAAAGAADEAASWIWSSALADENADAELLERLGQLGFAAPAETLARLHVVWRSGRYAGLGEASRQRFDLLVQRALEVVSAIEPVAARGPTLSRFLDLLEAVSRRGAYLALLTEYPAALRRVLSVLSASQWAAGYLTRHPQLLDELLDDEAMATPFDWPAFGAALRARLAAADGVEQQMDVLRHAHHAEVFRILLLDLGGHLSVEHVSDRLSELADAVLDVTLEAVWKQLPRRHREDPRFAIVAYGKLGGKELGYASDLDLIFLYDDAHEAAAQTYALYARRLITWLTTATGAGTLFDVDLRLRPNGASGMLVTDLDAFRRYQLREGDGANSAWVWEHQALSRARFCAGDKGIGQVFEAIRVQVLVTPREAKLLAPEIIAMRQRVVEGHPNHSALFDLKHDRGGMVDIEFTVQYLVLLHAVHYPELIRNTGNIALLREVARAGLLTDVEAEAVGGAYRTYRALQHRLRLDGMEAARVAPQRVAAERAAVLALWERVFGPAVPG